MKHGLLLALLILSPVALVTAQDSNYVDLRGLAAFRPGDDDVWRSKFIDEQEDWNFISVPGPWEANGFPLLDGFAWYRIRFQLPRALRNDSLLLIMSGVDDADETFLNGVMIGKTGSFPPDVRAEPRSLRVYPLPRSLREEHNLLAVRVYDRGDEGGITGSIFRIIRAEDITSVLDEIVDTPPPAHSLYISNGVMVSAISADSGNVRWCRPRLYDRISPDLPTENVLKQLQLTDARTSGLLPPPQTIAYLPGTGIVRMDYDEEMAVYLYHPRDVEQRVLVVAVQNRTKDRGAPGIRFVLEKPAWAYSEQQHESAGYFFTYHLLVYNSCCVELVDRDLEELLRQGVQAYGLDAEITRWHNAQAGMRYLPDVLTEQERAVYSQSVITLLQAMVRETGGGYGQIVSGFEPRSRAVAIPSDHLKAVRALATAGLVDRAREALDYVRSAEHGHYKLFDVYGTQHGVGHPYLISPAPWDGAGNEWRYERPDQAQLRFDGMASHIEAVDALREYQRSTIITSGAAFNDSVWIAPWWPALSRQVADILAWRLDSAGLLRDDDSPWNAGLHTLPSVYSSIRAAHALDIAARYAVWMADDLKAWLYGDAARRAREGVASIISAVMTAESAEALTPTEKRAFHPLLCDAVTMGFFPVGSAETKFVLDMISSVFSVDDDALGFHARPDGDWFERQIRPQIALRLARACAEAGMQQRAEALFASVSALASMHSNLLPELVDPVSGGLYGLRPSVVTAADYILTAERMAILRLTGM